MLSKKQSAGQCLEWKRKGIGKYMISNPRNASVLLSSMMSGADQQAVYNIVRTFTEFKSVHPRQPGQPYGIMDDKTWDTTINAMVDYLGAKRVAAKDMYTNEFIPTQYVPKAQMIPPILSFYDNLYALQCEKPDDATSPPPIE